MRWWFSIPRDFITPVPEVVVWAPVSAVYFMRELLSRFIVFAGIGWPTTACASGISVVLRSIFLGFLGLAGLNVFVDVSQDMWGIPEPGLNPMQNRLEVHDVTMLASGDVGLTIFAILGGES